MGMYTEIYVNTDLRLETPESVINVLGAICGGDHKAECLIPHPKRWAILFNSGSYYFPQTSAADLTFDHINGGYSLLAKGDIKNYDGEIEQFFEFIKPWCEDEFIGYHRHEDDREPTLVYTDNDGEFD